MSLLKSTLERLDQLRGIERISPAELDTRRRREIDEAAKMLADAAFPGGSYELDYTVEYDRGYRIGGTVTAPDGGTLEVKGSVFYTHTPKRSEDAVHLHFVIDTWTGASLSAEFRRGQLSAVRYHGLGGPRPRNEVAGQLARFREELAKPRPDLTSLYDAAAVKRAEVEASLGLSAARGQAPGLEP